MEMPPSRYEAAFFQLFRCQAFLLHPDRQTDKPQRQTEAAHSQALESVGADPHLSCVWLLRSPAGLKRREEGKAAVGGELSHLIQPGSCQLIMPFHFWEELWQVATQAHKRVHTLTHWLAKRTCMQTCSYTQGWQVRGDRERQLIPGGNPKGGEIEGSWESGAKKEETLRKLAENFCLFSFSLFSLFFFRAHIGVICFLPGVYFFSSLLKPKEVAVKLTTTERWSLSKKQDSTMQ